MTFTYYGHACFILDTGEYKLLFDPFISTNPLAAEIDINSIEADYIFLSHGHADHIGDAVMLAKKTQATVVCSWEIHEWMNRNGVDKTHPMNTGGSRKFDFGTVKCVVAQHSSGLPDGSYGGSPMGFIISAGGKNVYYSGDTALTLDMQLIPLWGDVDFCIFPIGDNFTMGVSDAIRAATFVQSNIIVGVHYNTFGYIVINEEEAMEECKRAGVTLILPAIGDTIDPKN
jgi:L-ascorbate metabolism protein UlaG (beta-lactamase superfamily)